MPPKTARKRKSAAFNEIAAPEAASPPSTGKGATSTADPFTTDARAMSSNFRVEIPPRKKTLHDDLDIGVRSAKMKAADLLKKFEDESSDDELSSVDSEVLEEVEEPKTKRVKLEAEARAATTKTSKSEKKSKKGKGKDTKVKKEKSTKKTKTKTKKIVMPDDIATFPPAPIGSRKAQPRKKTLFDELDTTKLPNGGPKGLLAKLEQEESESSSDPDSSDFEDVELPTASASVSATPGAASATPQPTTTPSAPPDSGSEDDDEFEDVDSAGIPSQRPLAGPTVFRKQLAPSSDNEGDLDLTLTRDTRVPLVLQSKGGGKKGPSKIERAIRVSTHQMHVLWLMWHNHVRSQWCNDSQVRRCLKERLEREKWWGKVWERWRRDSGLSLETDAEEPQTKGKGKMLPPPPPPPKPKVKPDRNSRDWASSSKPASPEKPKPNLSNGDPIIPLLNRLSLYFRTAFTITAPGLHKIGYMTLQRIDEEIKSFRAESGDVKRHGEKIDKEEFRRLARECEGSRDVGAQLFCALCRALGLETRLVCSLQPVGFGWSKAEDAEERMEAPSPKKGKMDLSDVEESEEDAESEGEPKPKKRRSVSKTPKKTPPPKTKRTGKWKTPDDANGSPVKVFDPAASDSDSSLSSLDSVVEVRPKKKESKNYEKGLPPIYWVEVLSPATQTWITCSPFLETPVMTHPDHFSQFEPAGSKCLKAKLVMCYIVAFYPEGTAKDVTVRYLKRHMWPGKTKGFRLPAEKIPVYDRHGKIKRHESYDWFATVMSGYVRPASKRTAIDRKEEETDLKPQQPEREAKEGEETLQSYKSSAEFVLARHLRREEALLPTAKAVKTFAVKGKGTAPVVSEPVYLRRDVVHCKSIETWHKEGRRPLPTAQPLKLVPYRAATTNRKLELAQREEELGRKPMQGLYAREQTEWIVPEPIHGGRIPKNEYGNMDVYVPSMVPKGATHLPLKGAKRICNKLGIDFAEAVTGFEFGARMAIPIVTGVVVAEENAQAVRDAWREFEAERVRKEDEKRRKVALSLWRKMMMGLRIIKRVREEYGDEAAEDDVLNSWAGKDDTASKVKAVEDAAAQRLAEKQDEDMAGGFLPEGHDEEEVPQSTFFPTRHDSDEEMGDADGGGGGFVVNDGEEEPNGRFFPSRHDSDEEMGEAGGFMPDADSDSDALPDVPSPPAASKPSKIKTPAKPSVKIAPKAASRNSKKILASTLKQERENEHDDFVPEFTTKTTTTRTRTKRSSTTKATAASTSTPAKPTKAPARRSARKSTGSTSKYFEGSGDEYNDE